MTYYNNKVELNRFIEKLLKTQEELNLKNLYSYAYLKYAFGKKAVNTYLEHLENTGSISIDYENGKVINEYLIKKNISVKEQEKQFKQPQEVKEVNDDVLNTEEKAILGES